MAIRDAVNAGMTNTQYNPASYWNVMDTSWSNPNVFGSSNLISTLATLTSSPEVMAAYNSLYPSPYSAPPTRSQFVGPPAPVDPRFVNIQDPRTFVGPPAPSMTSQLGINPPEGSVFNTPPSVMDRATAIGQAFLDFISSGADRMLGNGYAMSADSNPPSPYSAPPTRSQFVGPPAPVDPRFVNIQDPRTFVGPPAPSMTSRWGINPPEGSVFNTPPSVMDRAAAIGQAFLDFISSGADRMLGNGYAMSADSNPPSQLMNNVAKATRNPQPLGYKYKYGEAPLILPAPLPEPAPPVYATPPLTNPGIYNDGVMLPNNMA